MKSFIEIIWQIRIIKKSFNFQITLGKNTLSGKVGSNKFKGCFAPLFFGVVTKSPKHNTKDFKKPNVTKCPKNQKPN